MPEPLQDLFAALERPVTLLELVRIAVRLCAADGVDQKPIAGSAPDGRAWLELRADLGRAFRAGEHPAHLSREERATLMAVVRRALGVPAGVLAYMFLEAVDALDGNGLSHAFEAERPAAVLPGEVMAVAPATHLTAVFGPAHELSSQAHSVGRGLLSFKHFSVLPPLSQRYRVALKFAGEAEMDELLERKRVAVLLPNCRPWQEEFDLLPQPERECFGHVRPKDPEAQRAAIELALARADQMGTTIAILPELSVDSSAPQWLSEWMRTQSRSLKLLVAGSFHPPPGDPGRFNRCIVYDARGVELLSHHKFNRYVLGPLHEDLDAGERTRSPAACLASRRPSRSSPTTLANQGPRPMRQSPRCRSWGPRASSSDCLSALQASCSSSSIIFL